MSGPGQRSFKRSVFSSYVNELRRTGLFDEVRAAASPQLAALLDNPRSAPPWIDPPPIEELTAAVHARRGREGVRDLGYQVMKNGFTAIFEPIIHLSLTLLGTSPASLLSRAPLMLSITSRGVEMNWLPTGPSGGTMEVRCAERVPAINWIPWEGTLAYALELAGFPGTVGESRPAADGHSCEIDVSWTPR